MQKVDAGAHFIIVDVDPGDAAEDRRRAEGQGARCSSTTAPPTTACARRTAAPTSCTRRRRARCSPTRWRQYLVWKKWPHWFLVARPEPRRTSSTPRPCGAPPSASAPRSSRSARSPTSRGSRRTDGGFEQVQQQIPTFTQSAPDHDVLVVADEGNLFGDYFPYRTWDRAPRRRHRRPRRRRAGTRPSSCGAARSSRTASSASPTAPCARSTTTPGSPRAWSAKPPRAPRSANSKDLVAYMKSPNFDVAGVQGRRAVAAQLERPAAPADPGHDAQAARSRCRRSRASCTSSASSTRSASTSRKPNARPTHNERGAATDRCRHHESRSRRTFT